MGSKSKTIVSLLVLFCLTSIVLIPNAIVRAQTKTLVVPDQYPTIQSAIDSANNGDTVSVKKGYYPETLVVNKSISIIGEDRNHTIIDARKMGNSVIYINEANYVTVQNFTLGNSREIKPKYSGSGFDSVDGIRIGFRADYISIIDNTIIDIPFGHGIKTQSPTYNTTIRGNLIINCSANAIWVFGYNNYILDNQYAKSLGIEAGFSDNPPRGENNIIGGNREIVVTEDISRFPSVTPTPSPPTGRNAPLLDPVDYLIPISVIAAVVIVLTILFTRRHRKTSNLSK
jgi:hypothetical protein